MQGVRGVTDANVTFETLGEGDWGWPGGMGEGERERARGGWVEDGMGLYSAREGYHHMCRFFGG